MTATEAGDGALVAQQRVHASPVAPRADQRRELVGVGLGTELLERAVVALADHPPTRLALGAVLAHEQRDAVVEVQADHAALAAPGLLGRVLDVEPPGLR